MSIEVLSQIWPEWQIEGKPLGKGSFGVVYKAVRRDHNVESFAAIKVISIPSDPSEVDSLRSEGLDINATRTYLQGIVNDFVSEIQLMESLKGVQNIVSVEDYKVVEKTDEIGWDIYIRMELLTSFNQYIGEKKLSEKEVIKLGYDICTALEICAKRNIIHRDIKPENIFINDFGYFKLGDFGIARKMENITGGLSQKGTWYYIAPEVVNGTKYDARVDIYSLGIVLYRLLNRNRFPFLDPEKQVLNLNERNDALNRRLRGEKLPVPCEASPAMAHLILRACAYDPNMRFASATEMKQALVDVANGKYQMNANNLDSTIYMRKVQENYDRTPVVGQAPALSGQRSEPMVNTFGYAQKKNRAIPVAIVAVLATVFLVVAGIFTISIISNTQQIATFIDEAAELASIADYKGALDKIEEGLSEHADSKKLQEKADEYKKQIKEQLLASAESLAESGDYAAAMSEIQEAQDEYGYDDDYQKAYSKYNNALTKKKTLSEAESFAANGEYESALTTLENVRDTFENDMDWKTAYDTYNKKYFAQVKKNSISEADELAENGDYLGAVDIIKRATSTIGEDSELKNKAEAYEDAYVSAVISDTDRLMNENKFDDAVKGLQEALKVFPDNEQLKEKRTSVEEHKPILLTSLHVVDEKYYEVGPCTDTYGNTYNSAFTVGSYQSWPGFVVFNLNREYSKLTITIAPSSDGDPYDVGYKICIDDNPIHSASIETTTEPQTITLDVTGCSLLKFERLDGGGVWGDKVIFGNAYIQK